MLSTASSLTPPRQALDEGALLAYLQSLPQLSGVSGPVHIQQFSHGQSNPTYLVTLNQMSMSCTALSAAAHWPGRRRAMPPLRLHGGR